MRIILDDDYCEDSCDICDGAKGLGIELTINELITIGMKFRDSQLDLPTYLKKLIELKRSK